MKGAPTMWTWIAILRGLGRGRSRGGVVQPAPQAGDRIPAMLSEGCGIIDADQAESLGLTGDARRMRERRCR